MSLSPYETIQEALKEIISERDHEEKALDANIKLRLEAQKSNAELHKTVADLRLALGTIKNELEELKLEHQACSNQDNKMAGRLLSERDWALHERDKAIDRERALKTELEKAKAYSKNLEDQEVGQAVDCWECEKAARADERDITRKELVALQAELDALKLENSTLADQYMKATMHAGTKHTQIVLTERLRCLNEFEHMKGYTVHDVVALMARIRADGKS